MTLPYIPARLQWPRSSVVKAPTLIVMHDMEAPEGPLTAENCARFFQNPNSTGSAHVCSDENSSVRSVQDDHMAAGARGFPYKGKTVNDWALHLEQAGFARQTRAEWLDSSSRATIAQAAAVVAEWCTAYSIPVVHLNDGQLIAGGTGIVGHADVSRALKVSGGHTDPGAGYPWDVFLPMVLANMGDDEMWTDAEKARILAGADAEVAMNKRWDDQARTKLEEVWTNLMDRDHAEPGFRKGNVGAMVQQLLYPPTATGSATTVDTGTPVAPAAAARIAATTPTGAGGTVLEAAQAQAAVAASAIENEVVDPTPVKATPTKK